MRFVLPRGSRWHPAGFDSLQIGSRRLNCVHFVRIPSSLPSATGFKKRFWDLCFSRWLLSEKSLRLSSQGAFSGSCTLMVSDNLQLWSSGCPEISKDRQELDQELKCRRASQKKFLTYPQHFLLRLPLTCQRRLSTVRVDRIYLYSSVASRKAKMPGIKATTKATKTWVSDIDIAFS